MMFVCSAVIRILEERQCANIAMCWAWVLGLGLSTNLSQHTTLVLHLLLLNLSSCVTFTFLSFVPKLQLHKDREVIEPQ